MLKYEDKNYKVCLLDTCVISDFFEDSFLYQKFLNLLIQENLLIGISISTILELKKSSERYDWFKIEFTELPTFLLKPSDLLLKDEMKNYPDENTEKFLFYYLFKGKDLLEYFDNSRKFQEMTLYLEKNKQIALDSILELVENFSPEKNGKFSNLKINEFVKRVTRRQLLTFFPDWARNNGIQNNFDSEKFKSLRSQLLITFWKFYLLKERKARKSDIFDITIISALPYVDLVITEKNMKNDIDQIKRKKLFFDNLKALTITELKTTNP